MANKILSAAPDKSIAKALDHALKAPKNQGRISDEEVQKILQAAHDDKLVSDVEFRDLKRILRTQKLWGPSIRLIEAYLQPYYPLTGPFVYPGEIESLEGTERLGSQQCAALVQSTIPIGLTATWREGIPLRGNDHLIEKGTAVATFEDGFYANRSHDNHVAYYVSQDKDGIVVMDQWKADNKPTVASRTMRYLGKWVNGLYKDPSNNGNALSVIMKKA